MGRRALVTPGTKKRRKKREGCMSGMRATGPDATAVGRLLARTVTSDIADAHVVTSDADDLRRIAAGLQLVVV